MPRRSGVTVVKSTLRVDEAGQKVALEVLSLGHDVNMGLPTSRRKGNRSPRERGHHSPDAAAPYVTINVAPLS
jgi:hypothetical protein